MHNITEQEAQLPLRNSASAAHMKGATPSAHFPYAPSGYTYAYGRIRNPQQTYVKRAGKTANSLISTTPLNFEDVRERNAFEYQQMIYIARI